MVRKEFEQSVDDLVDLVNRLYQGKERRMLLGMIAEIYGPGGEKHIQERTGMSWVTLRRGRTEGREILGLSDDAVRAKEPLHRQRPVYGEPEKPEKFVRARSTREYPQIGEWIWQLLDERSPLRAGRVLRWLPRDLTREKLVELLEERHGAKVSAAIIGPELRELGFIQMNNQEQGVIHPSQEEQLSRINDTAEQFLAWGDPVIWVDAQRRESVATFEELNGKNVPIWEQKDGLPTGRLKRTAPGGVCVLDESTAFARLNAGGEGVESAAESLSLWYSTVGRRTFPQARRLLVVCERTSRGSCWEGELQRVADRSGMEIRVAYCPSGTFRWERVLHRLFCFTTGGRGNRGAVDIETGISLIGSSAMAKDFPVQCGTDRGRVVDGYRQVDEAAEINREAIDRYGDWNFVIRPSGR